MTVNNYLDTLNEEQIVTVFNDKHNIIYHGKAGYAPLNLYFEFRNATENGVDLIINGIVETKENIKTEQIAKILEKAHKLRKTPYGCYLYRDDLRKIISDVMGFKYYSFFGGTRLFDFEKVKEVERQMLDKIKFSKKGNMFKFI